MGQLSIPKTYSDGNTLSAAMLDAIRTSLETFFNVTKIDSANIQTGGVSTANLGDGVVTSAKLAASVAGTGLTGGSGSPLTLADGGIATEKLADGAVTQAKLAVREVGSTVGAGGLALSSSCGTFSTSVTGNFVQITNLSITITTLGGPVSVSLVSDGGSNPSSVSLSFINFTKDGTTIAAFDNVGFAAPGSYQTIDNVAAGTYTYAAVARATGGSPALCSYLKLTVREI